MYKYYFSVPDNHVYDWSISSVVNDILTSQVGAPVKFVRNNYDSQSKLGGYITANLYYATLASEEDKLFFVLRTGFKEVIDPAHF